MTALTVQVTADDIREGEPGNGWACPIALAIQRVVGLSTVSVHAETVRIGAVVATYDLPERAQRFIEMFDLWEPVDPFTFELDLPERAA